MVMDVQHSQIEYRCQEIEHNYPKNVHIVANPYLQTILARLGTSKTVQPQVNYDVIDLYRHLMVEVINSTFPIEFSKVETRMKEFTPKGVFEGDTIQKNTSVVVVDLARAGTLPSGICFDYLNHFLNPAQIVYDHFYINRAVNEKGEVVGVNVSGSKIAGVQDNAYVLIPDPMGATGGSICKVISHYKSHVKGKALKYIVMHLVITPEYIKRITDEHPDVEIFSIRLDRGLSIPKVLQSIPGTYWDEEIGLTETSYIVPGLGGVGEIINNCYV